MYRVLCTITANTQQIAKTLKPQYGLDGRTFYKLDYDVVLLFGLTELQAHVSWKYRVRIFLVGSCSPIHFSSYRGRRKGKMCVNFSPSKSHRYGRGPARIIYAQHL